jgi:mutator protein MutT
MRWLRRFVGPAPLIMAATAACIRDRDGRVLLMRRGGEEAELWGFPGGALELGESAAEGVVREVREEVGLEVVPDGLIGVYSHPEYAFSYPGGDRVQPLILLFACRAVGGQLVADGEEALAVRYFGPHDPLPPLRPCCAAKLRDAFSPAAAPFLR